jgi:hypothetical protein
MVVKGWWVHIRTHVADQVESGCIVLNALVPADPSSYHPADLQIIPTVGWPTLARNRLREVNATSRERWVK